MSDQPTSDLETDPRFPSGPWTGFFLQKSMPGRQPMELRLQFRSGTIVGEGRDRVGPFTIRGIYSVDDGKCRWHKRYIAKHDVHYQGFGENKGIWGTWEMAIELCPVANTGGFHIWPEGMPDPTQPTLSEEADLPVTVEELVPALPVGEEWQG